MTPPLEMGVVRLRPSAAWRPWGSEGKARGWSCGHCAKIVLCDSQITGQRPASLYISRSVALYGRSRGCMNQLERSTVLNKKNSPEPRKPENPKTRATRISGVPLSASGTLLRYKGDIQAHPHLPQPNPKKNLTEKTFPFRIQTPHAHDQGAMPHRYHNTDFV